MRVIKLSIIFLLIHSLGAPAQAPMYPKGAYMSIDEIIDKTPSVAIDLTVEKRSKGEIKMNGGNDYQLVSADKAISKKYLKKEILAYSLGDTLYLNCFPYKLQTWYAAVIGDGDYLVFKGGISQNQELYQKQMAMGMAFGAIGGAIAGAKIAMMRFLYALDKSTNTVTAVDEESMKKLLQNAPELLSLFEQEQDKKDEAVLLKYLEMLNRKRDS